MSLSDTDVKAKYNANGATTTFAIPFLEIDSYASEVAVYTVDESADPPTETLKTYTTHYTIVGTNVVFVSAPANGLKVLVIKVMSLVQTAFEGDDNGPYPAVEAETAYDRLTAMIQILDEKIKRAVKWRKSTAVATIDPLLPDPEADALVKWNAAADGLENTITLTDFLADVAAAAASATAAAASQAAAASSATSAASSATAAASSATAAASSATAAAASAAAAAAFAMSGGPFVLADNQVAAANVTALLFPTASAVANFKFRFHRGAGINGVIDLTCWKDSTGAWNIFQGVDQGNGTSGLTFSLTTSGLYQQVQYTSTSVGAAGEGHWTGAAV